jgi:hypothetical protein
MFIAIFHFEVEPEDQAEFLQVVKDRIKPYWESHGCWSYNVYQAYDAEAGPGRHFVKTQIMEGMPSTVEESRAKRTPESQEVVERFYRYAKNVTFKGYLKRA